MNIQDIKNRIRNLEFRLKKNTATLIFGLCPIQKNKIVADNFLGKGYGDNPKYIVEELLKADKGYDIVWLVSKNVSDNFPKGVRTVEYGTFSALYEYATAHLWIDNVRNSLHTRKKSGQIYLQTWHGAFPVKPIEKDAEDTLNSFYVFLAKKDGKITDAIVAGSQKQIELFKRAFWLNENVEYLRYGTPKSDILFESFNDTDLQEEVRSELKISNDSRIILYAPTFRDDNSTRGYLENLDKVIKAFEDKFGERYIIIVRMHPNAKNHINCYTYGGSIINGTNYPDMQKLCVAADWLITDYSSSVYDFMLLNKPVFLYESDYQDYKKVRGISKEFEECVFPKAYSFSELLDNIRNFDKKRYDETINIYLQNHPVYDNGKASKNIADWIIRKMEGK